MTTVNKEVYNIVDTLANIVANLKDKERGVVSDTPTDFNHNFVHKNEGKYYASAVSKTYNGSWSYSNVVFRDMYVHKLLDSFVTDGIALSEENNDGLIDFENNSIVGALNELNSELNYWTKTVIDGTKDYLIPLDYGSNNEFLHVGSGLMDANSEVPGAIKVGDPDNTELASWYSTMDSIIGCFNIFGKIKNYMQASRIADLSVTAGTTTIIFDDEDEDTDAMYDPVTGIFTAYYAGLYQIVVNLNIDVLTANTIFDIQIFVNSGVVLQESEEITVTKRVSLSCTVCMEIPASATVVVKIVCDNNCTIKQSAATFFKVHRYVRD